MWTANEASPRQFRNQLIEPAATAPAESAQPDEAPVTGRQFTYDNWRRHLSLIRAALVPFPLALAAVLSAIEQDLE